MNLPSYMRTSQVKSERTSPVKAYFEGREHASDERYKEGVTDASRQRNVIAQQKNLDRKKLEQAKWQGKNLQDNAEAIASDLSLSQEEKQNKIDKLKSNSPVVQEVFGDYSIVVGDEGTAVTTTTTEYSNADIRKRIDNGELDPQAGNAFMNAIDQSGGNSITLEVKSRYQGVGGQKGLVPYSFEQVPDSSSKGAGIGNKLASLVGGLIASNASHEQIVEAVRQFEIANNMLPGDSKAMLKKMKTGIISKAKPQDKKKTESWYSRFFSGDSEGEVRDEGSEGGERKYNIDDIVKSNNKSYRVLGYTDDGRLKVEEL